MKRNLVLIIILLSVVAALVMGNRMMSTCVGRRDSIGKTECCVDSSRTSGTGTSSCLMKNEDPSFDTLMKDMESTDDCIRATAAVNLGILGDSRAVPRLVKAMDDKSRVVSTLSAWSLGKLKDKRGASVLIRHLSKCLKEFNAVSPFVVWALGEIGDPRAADVLLQLVGEGGDSGDKELALESLYKIGDPRMLGVFRKLLRSRDEDLRITSLNKLGLLKDRASIPAISKCLYDPVERARREAAASLGNIGDKSAVPALLESIEKCPGEDQRRSIARALAEIDGQEAASALVSLLNHHKESARIMGTRVFDALPVKRKITILKLASTCPDRSISEHAVLLIKKFDSEDIQDNPDENKHEQAVKAGLPRRKNFIGLLDIKDIDELNLEDYDCSDLQNITKILGNRDKVDSLLKKLNSDNPLHRRYAALGLGNIRGENDRIIPALITRIRNKDSDTRWNVINSLGKLGDRRAVPALLEALEDDDKDVREKAVEALGRIGGADLVEPSMKMLEDDNAEVRISAAKTLGKLKDKRALPLLIKTLKDPEPRARKDAAEILGEMGDKSAMGPLMETLNDRNENVARAAGKAMEKLKVK